MGVVPAASCITYAEINRFLSFCVLKRIRPALAFSMLETALVGYLHFSQTLQVALPFFTPYSCGVESLSAYSLIIRSIHLALCTSVCFL
jgi:hypothetical protein